MENAIGMVFGYNTDATYDEKFVVQPRLATKPGSSGIDSYTKTDNKQIRKHFLENMYQEESGLLVRLLQPLVDQVG